MADTILVTGATGKVGCAVVEALRACGATTRMTTRRSLTAADTVRLDWNDPTTFAPALAGTAAVFLVAPTDRTDHLAAMQPFLEQATAQADRRLVLLSAASLCEGGPMMGAVQAWLRAHAPHWVSLRPSWFMQNFTTQHLPGIRADHCLYSATGDGRVGFIDVRDIAAVAAAALLGELPNGEVVLTGPEALSYDDIAAAIGAVSGRAVRHCRLTTAELAGRHERSGLPHDYAVLLARMDEAIASGVEDRTTDAVERITGRPPRRFEAFADEQKAQFAVN